MSDRGQPFGGERHRIRPMPLCGEGEAADCGTPGRRARPKVLIIAHDARAPGGVNNFLRIMRLRFRGRIDAVRFANGPRAGRRGGSGSLSRMARDYLRFIALVRRTDFDVLHMNPSMDYSSMPRELLFAWLGRMFRPSMRSLVFYRGWNWEVIQTLKGSRLKRSLFLLTHHRIDRILVLADEFKTALVELGLPAGKMFLTTTTFDGVELKKALDRTPAKQPQILFMSRFLPSKGGAETIEAFARVLADSPGWSLVMAGDGPEMSRLQHLASELGVGSSVRFAGYVRGMEKMQILAESSIFVLPSRHAEGMPNAVLEAMAAGEVVIATAVGGTKSVVADGINGAILPSPTVEHIAQSLAVYMRDTELTRSVGMRNRATAWQKFESATVADRLADHYIQVIQLPKA